MDSSPVSSNKATKPATVKDPLLKPRGDEFEDDTVLQLGYVTSYRRVFQSIGNMCMVISLTS